MQYVKGWNLLFSLQGLVWFAKVTLWMRCFSLLEDSWILAPPMVEEQVSSTHADLALVTSVVKSFCHGPWTLVQPLSFLPQLAQWKPSLKWKPLHWLLGTWSLWQHSSEGCTANNWGILLGSTPISGGLGLHASYKQHGSGIRE